MMADSSDAAPPDVLRVRDLPPGAAGALLASHGLQLHFVGDDAPIPGSFWGEPEARNGRFLTPARAINHTDEELEFLAQLVDQRTAWQVLGRKGVKDGQGYMEERPAGAHPATPR